MKISKIPLGSCSHHCPSIKTRIVLRKLGFLVNLPDNERDDLASHVFQSLSVDNVYSISLVEQCRWLLEELGLGWNLHKCLSDSLTPNTVKDLQTIIYKRDWCLSVNSARKHSSLKYIVCSDQVAANWCSMWNRALDLGKKELDSQCLFSTLCRPVFGDQICPLCKCLPTHQNYFDHFTPSLKKPSQIRWRMTVSAFGSLPL